MRRSTNAQTLKLAGWFAAFVLPVLITAETSAQSGRRAPRTTATRNATKSPDPVQPISPVFTPELSRRLTILAARQPTDKRFIAEDAIYASFINRLNEYASVKASSIGDLKRNQAVKRARAEAESFVVLLQFSVDSFQEGTILLNSHDLVVEYAVYEPLSGKLRSKGKVFYQQVGGGRLRKSQWPTGTPIKITTEAAGIEAAEQLYAWLVLKIGVKR